MVQANAPPPSRAMKLHLDQSDSSYRISSYGPGYVAVNERRLTRSFIVTPRHLITDWGPRSIGEVDTAALARVHELAPAIALLGTGESQVFPELALLEPLMRAHIGVEVMTTAAACRTFNILIGEGRAVAAMLIVEG